MAFGILCLSVIAEKEGKKSVKLVGRGGGGCDVCVCEIWSRWREKDGLTKTRSFEILYTFFNAQNSREFFEKIVFSLFEKNTHIKYK